MSVYRDLHQALADHQDALRVDHAGPEVRLMKLSEEVGEVMQAYIGVVGANKRKGHYATARDVADELCDVVITAMVALHDWDDDPELLLEDKIQALRARVEEEGS